MLNPVYHHFMFSHSGDFTTFDVNYDKHVIKSNNKVNVSTLKLKPSYNYQSDINMLNTLSNYVTSVKPDGILYNHDYTKLKFIKNNDSLIPLDNITPDDARKIKTLPHSVDVNINVTDKKYNYTNSGVVYKDYQIGPVNYEVNTPTTESNAPTTPKFDDIRLCVESIWNYLNPSTNNTVIKLEDLIDYNTIESHYSNTTNLYSATDSFDSTTAVKLTDNNTIAKYKQVYIIKELLNNVAQTSLDTLRVTKKNVYSLQNVDVFYVIERSSTVDDSDIQAFINQFSLTVVSLYDVILSLVDYYTCLVKNRCYEFNNRSKYTKSSKLVLNELGYSIDVIVPPSTTPKITIDADVSTLSNNTVGQTLELLKDNVIITQEELRNNGNDIISGKWGTCDWTLNYYGILTIKKGVGASITENTDPKSPWTKYADQIKVINIEDKITFKEGSQLNGLFRDLTKLTMINGLDKLNTAGVTSMRFMFSSCASVYSLDVSKFNTSDVTDMERMFEGCEAVESLNLSSFDTSNVRLMYLMFANNTNIKLINLSSFDVSKVIDMSNMFQYCKSLNKIIFGNDWKTTNVQYLSRMFYNCEKLTELDLSNFDTSKVTDMSYMFYGCKKLTELDLSNFNMNSITNSQYCLASLTGLTKFTTPNDFGSIDDNIIKNIENVKAAFGSDKWKIDHSDMKYNTISSVLANTTYIKQQKKDWGTCKWYVENNILYIESSKDNQGNYNGKGESTTKNDDETYTSPFDEYKSNIIKIVIEGKITFDKTSGTDSTGNPTETATVRLDSLFEGFSSLVEIEGLNNLDTTNVASMNNMFKGCSQLVLLDLTSFNTTSITKDNSSSPYNIQGFLAGTNKLFRFISPEFERDTSNPTELSTQGQAVSQSIANSLSGKWKDESDASSKFEQLTELKSKTPYVKESSTIWGLASNGCPWLFSEATGTLYITGGKAVSVNVEVDNENNINDNTDSRPWKAHISDIKRVEILGPITFETGSIISGLFRKYPNLEEINGIGNIKLTDGNTPVTVTVSAADNLLTGCDKLKRVDLSDLDLSQTTQFNNPVDGCSGLVEFKTPTSMSDTNKNSIVTSLNTINAKGWKDKTDTTNAYATLTTTSIAPSKDYIVYGFGYWGQCEFNLVDTTITVQPGLVDKTYTNSPFKDYSGVVTKIIIEVGVIVKQSVSLDNLFKDLALLETITGLSTVEFNDCSRKHMFDGCTSLIDYDYNSFVTDSGTAFDSMLNNCSALTSLDISNFKFNASATVENFNTGCTAIEYIKTPDDQSSTAANTVATALLTTDYKRGDGTTTTKLDGVPIFKITNTLEKLGDCNVIYENGVLSISSGSVTALPTTLPWDDYKTNIKQVKILGKIEFSFKVDSDGNLEVDENNKNIVSIAGLFDGLTSCTSIENIKHLVGTNSTSVTNISNLFKNCSSLTELDLSDWDVSGVTTATDFVFGCSSLITIKSPKTLPTTDVISSEINSLGSWTNVTSPDYIYGTITTLETDTTYYTSAHGKWGTCEWKWNDTAKTITIYGGKGSSTLTIADPSDNTSEPYSIFDVHKSDVTKIIIEDTITFDSTGATLDGLFKDCSELVEIINFNKLNTVNVTSMNKMFSGCGKLAYLDLNNFNVASVTSINNFLTGCSNLIRLVTPNGNTTLLSSILDSLGSTKWKLEGNNGDFGVLTELQPQRAYISETQTIWGVSQSVCCWTILNGTLYITGGQGAGTSLSNGKYQTPWSNQLENIKHVNILGNITFKPGTSLAGLFAECVNLVSVTGLGKLQWSNVNDVTKMFENCESLNLLDLSDVTLPTTVTDMCSGCLILRQITFKSDTVDTTITNITSSLPSPTKWKPETSNTKIIAKTLTKSYDISKKYKYYVSENIFVIEGGTITTNQLSGKCASVTKVKILSDTIATGNVLKKYFDGFSGCTSFEGLEYLDTTESTDMSYMFNGCNNIKTLDLSTFVTHSVTNMSYMFNGCGQLSTLEVNKDRFRTDNVTNMDAMFCSCSSLTQLDVGYFNTDRVISMIQTFQKCSSITELDLSKWSTANVTNMSYMFDECSNLIEVDVSEFDTNKVTTFNSMFSGCISLTHLNFTSFRFGSTTDANLVDIFTGTNLLIFKTPVAFVSTNETTIKEKLGRELSSNNNVWKKLKDISNKSIEFKSLDTIEQDVIYVSNKAVSSGTETYWGTDNTYGCRYKVIDTTLFIGPGIGKVNSTDCPFVNNTNKTTITKVKILGDIVFEKGSNINIDGLFSGLTALTEIEGLNFIDTTDVSSVSNMFNGCTSLENIVIPHTLISGGVKSVNGMFDGCSKLKKIKFEINKDKTATSPVELNVTDVSNWFKDCKELIQIDLSMFDMSKITTATNTFEGCVKLLRFVTPNAFDNNSIDNSSVFKTTIITFMNIDKLWKKQDDLTFGELSSIAISTAYVHKLNGNIWGTCVYYIDEETKTLHISSGEGLSQTNTTQSFWDEHKNIIERIEIHGSITLPESSSLEYLFANLYNLEYIDSLNSFITTNVNSMCHMFENCYNLKTIVPEVKNNNDGGETVVETQFNTLKFDISNVTDMSNMFSQCYNLTEVSIELTKDTQTISISSMFNQCYSLVSFNVLSADDTLKVTSISNTFNQCYNLKSVNMTKWKLDGVTTLEGLFNQCYNLQTVEFKDEEVTGITDVSNMFNECHTLNKLDLSMFNFNGVTTSVDWLNECKNLTYFKAPKTLPVDDTTSENDSTKYLTNLSSFMTGKAWFDTTDAVQYSSTDTITLQPSHIYIILNSQNDTYEQPTYPIYYLYKPDQNEKYTLEHMIFGDLMMSKSDFSTLTDVGKIRFVVQNQKKKETTFRSEPFILDSANETEVVIRLPEIKHNYSYLHTLFNDLILKDSCVIEYTQLELTRYDFKRIESIQNCAITCDMIIFNSVQQVTFRCDKLVYDEDIDKFIITNGYCAEYSMFNFNGVVSILSDRILALATLGKTNNKVNGDTITAIANRPTLTIVMKNGSRLIGIPRRFNINSELYNNTYITPMANSSQLLGLTDSVRIPYDTPIIFDDIEQKIRPITYEFSTTTQFDNWVSTTTPKGLVDSVEYDITKLKQSQMN